MNKNIICASALYKNGIIKQHLNDLLIDPKKYDTLIIDIKDSFKSFDKFSNLENIIIDPDKCLVAIIYKIDNIKSISIGEVSNATDISINYNTAKNINKHYIHEYNLRNGNDFYKINIVFDDEIIPINFNEKISLINISSINNEGENNLKLYVETPSFNIEYIIDDNKNIKKSKNYAHLLEKEYPKINLCEYDTLVTSYNTRIKELIIDNKILERDDFDFDDLIVKDIILTNNDDMRLIPQSKILNINSSIHLFRLNNNLVIICYNNPIECYRSINKVMIVDKNLNVSYIYDKTLKKDSKYRVTYSDEFDDNYYILKYKKEKKIIYYDAIEKYKISKLFKKYIEKNCKRDLFSIIGNKEKLKKTYEDYKIWFNKLIDLNKLGISRKSLYYILFSSNEIFKNILLYIENNEIREKESKEIDTFTKTLIKFLPENQKINLRNK